MPDWLQSPWLILPIAVATGAALLLAWRAFSRRPARVGQRIGLWLAALFFTFFGPLSATEPNWPLVNWAAAVNMERDFKDLWLAMIAMLVFSLSNIADNLIRGYRDLSTFTQTFVPILLALYFIAIVLGMVKYSTFAGHQLPDAQFRAYWTWIEFGTGIGILWELLIALETKD